MIISRWPFILPGVWGLKSLSYCPWVLMLANISLIMFLLLCIPCEFRNNFAKAEFWSLTIAAKLIYGRRKQQLVCMVCFTVTLKPSPPCPKRKPNETQKDPPSVIFSSFGLLIVSLKQCPSIHLQISLHFDHIFFFYWNMRHIPYNWSFLCKYAVLVFIVF